MYEPVPVLSCPFCATALDEWQGSDAACALLVWRQGLRNPVAQRADEPLDDIENLRLPDQFRISTNCPNDGQPLDADGRCVDGVWQETAPCW